MCVKSKVIKSLGLASVLAVSSLVPAMVVDVESVHAQTPNPESDFTIDTSIGAITGYKGTRKDVVIPDTINGIKVEIIGRGSFKNKGLTRVAIPSGVRLINSDAFYDNNLTSVDIPDSVTSIGGYAFTHNNLTSVDI